MLKIQRLSVAPRSRSFPGTTTSGAIRVACGILLNLLLTKGFSPASEDRHGFSNPHLADAFIVSFACSDPRAEAKIHSSAYSRCTDLHSSSHGAAEAKTFR